MPKTAGELARSRRDIGRALTETCTLKRPAATLTDDGYPSDSETTVAEDVPCRLSGTGMNPWEQQIGGQVQAVGTYTLMLPYGTDIRGTDIVELGSRRFEVLGRTAPATDDVVLRVHVTEFDG